MKNNLTHYEMINLWSELKDFAEDIGTSTNTAKGMRHRGSVLGGYWLAMEAGAKKRGIEGVSLKTLAIAAAETRLNSYKKKKKGRRK